MDESGGLDWKTTKNLCHLCEACGKTNGGLFKGKKLLKCGGCKFANYCSKECQRSHWKVHKPMCKARQEGLKADIEHSGKSFVKDVDDWRKGSAMLFGAMAKVAIPIAQRDTHFLMLNSKYDPSFNETAFGADGKEYQSPKIQIFGFEKIEIASMRGTQLQFLYDGMIVNVKPRPDMYSICHVVEHTEVGVRPLFRLSNVGHESKLSHPIEEFIRQANSGVMDIRTLC
jgi:hypothetical protein